VVVCVKLDRIRRSLNERVKLVEKPERNGCADVAVVQGIDKRAISPGGR